VILDFGLRILDLKTVAGVEPWIRAFFNPKSKFQNPKFIGIKSCRDALHFFGL
jgi:hypothetical protein